MVLILCPDEEKKKVRTFSTASNLEDINFHFCKLRFPFWKEALSKIKSPPWIWRSTVTFVTAAFFDAAFLLNVSWQFKTTSRGGRLEWWGNSSVSTWPKPATKVRYGTKSWGPGRSLGVPPWIQCLDQSSCCLVYNDRDGTYSTFVFCRAGPKSLQTLYVPWRQIGFLLLSRLGMSVRGRHNHSR